MSFIIPLNYTYNRRGDEPLMNEGKHKHLDTDIH